MGPEVFMLRRVLAKEKSDEELSFKEEWSQGSQSQVAVRQTACSPVLCQNTKIISHVKHSENLKLSLW